jgi:hypothetical protein
MTVEVKVTASGFEEIKRRMGSQAVGRRVAKLIIDEMKKSLSRGVSPVRGVRRFPRYKDPMNYPGDQKSRLPVNLKLSGDMLDSLAPVFRGSRMWIEIGKDQTDKASAHQEGTPHMAARRFMPTNEGEEFTVTIQRSVRNLYARILSDIISSVR